MRERHRRGGAAGALLVLVLLVFGCSKMAEEPVISCWVNEDCPTDSYCEGAAAAASPLCVPAQTGACRAVADSMLGAACASHEDCASTRLYCSATFHDCEVDQCLFFQAAVVCNAGDCPDGGTDGGVIECRPGCRAGTSNIDGCRFCFCPTCP
jgi:hypothetical protein